MRLGKRQMQLLSAMAGVGTCLVVHSDISRTLCRRGLMVATAPDCEGMIVVTPAGLRELAAAMEAGHVEWHPDWEAVRKKMRSAD